MVRRSIALCAVLAMLGIGCSSGGNADGYDTNRGGATGGGGDAGVSGTGGGGSGGVAGTSGGGSGGVAGTNDGGTGGATPVEARTNQPQIDFSGTGDVVITSAFLALKPLASLASFQMQGDLLNTTDQLQCIPLIHLSLGDLNVLSVAIGPGYYIEETMTSSSYPCLLPHGTAMFSSIENSVATTLLDTATQVTYVISSIPSSTAILHPAIPQQIPAVVEAGASSTWHVKGQITLQSMPVDSLEINVFPRDAQGFAFDSLFFSQDDVAPSVPIDFTTSFTGSSFTDFDLFARVTVLDATAPTTTQSLSSISGAANSLAARARTHNERVVQATEAWGRAR